MKIIKNGSSSEHLISEIFNFKPINDLSELDILTSYIEGQSPEYKSDIDKLFMVIQGKLQLKVDEQSTKMETGDIILLKNGEKFQFNAAKGAKLLQLTPTVFSKKSEGLKELAFSRRSIRNFSDKPVLKKDIYYILKTGMQAPSGANLQPWKFIVVGDAEIKRKIREHSEKIEKNYHLNNQNTKLLNEIKDMGLTWNKPFLESAPYLICVFGDHSQAFCKESLWLATGWMILAAEELGLSTLTYTPSNMNFLNNLLNVNEQFTPELIIPIGYMAESEDKQPRKDMYEVVSWV